MPNIEITQEQAEKLARGESITLAPKKKRREYPEGVLHAIDVAKQITSEHLFFEKAVGKRYFDIYEAFATAQEAKAELEYRKAVNHIRRYIDDNFEYWTPDWSDSNQDKYTPCYFNDCKEWISEDSSTNQFVLPFRYLQSHTQCKQLIKDCLPQLEVIRKYNF